MRRQGSPILDVAETFLMVPDLFAWLLTGRKVGERTDASTTQIYDPNARNWSDELCASFNIPRRIFPELVDPGTAVGPLLPSVIDEIGRGKGLTVIAPATHDTASAVAAVPALGEPTMPPEWCYLSSGTWSLLGVETTVPVINESTLKYNFTNEGGVAGTTRLLKNIMGLWLVQECRRTWSRRGREFSYDELIAMAAAARPFGPSVDPDDPLFLAPGDMPARIADFCRRTGQKPPEDEGSFVHCAWRVWRSNIIGRSNVSKGCSARRFARSTSSAAVLVTLFCANSPPTPAVGRSSPDPSKRPPPATSSSKPSPAASSPRSANSAPSSPDLSRRPPSNLATTPPGARRPSGLRTWWRRRNK